jgi:hypothetical protein
MEILKFIFQLGIIFMVFQMIWGFFMLIYRLLTGLSERPVYETFAFKILNNYFLISLSAIQTLQYTQKPGNPGMLMVMLAIAVLYSYMAGRLERNRFVIQMNNMRVNTERVNMSWETLLILASLVYYSFAINQPEILNNSANKWFYDSVMAIYETPIIGWIFMFLGFFFLLINLIKSVYVTASAITWVMERIAGKPRNNGNDNDNDGYTSYEEVNDDQLP